MLQPGQTLLEHECGFAVRDNWLFIFIFIFTISVRIVHATQNHISVSLSTSEFPGHSSHCQAKFEFQFHLADTQFVLVLLEILARRTAPHWL